MVEQKQGTSWALMIWLHLDVPKKLGSMASKWVIISLLIDEVYWGYKPFTNHLLTSWHIQVYDSPLVRWVRVPCPQAECWTATNCDIFSLIETISLALFVEFISGIIWTRMTIPLSYKYYPWIYKNKEACCTSQTPVCYREYFTNPIMNQPGFLGVLHGFVWCILSC